MTRNLSRADGFSALAPHKRDAGGLQWPPGVYLRSSSSLLSILWQLLDACMMDVVPFLRLSCCPDEEILYRPGSMNRVCRCLLRES